MPLKALCIELRPNLSSGHMLLQFDREIRDSRKKRLVIKEHDVHIVENVADGSESVLVLRHNSFGMDIQHISIFLVDGCHISFRFNYTQIDLDSLQTAGGAIPVLPQPLRLSFVESKDIVALQCSNCQHELVPGTSYKRLREFPSGLVDPSEFFCHSHSHGTPAQPATLVPGPHDLYYGLNHIVLNMAVLEARVIKSSGHLYCSRCMWLLGLTIESGAAGKLWADALRWLAPPVTTSTDAAPAVPRQLFQYSTVTQLMLRLLSSLWPQSGPQLSPNSSRALLIATMPNRQQHYMLIQVLEPQLSVLRSNPNETPPDPQQLRYYRACKLYFRVYGNCQHQSATLDQWQQEMEVPKLTISPYLFLELQARLNRNSLVLPHSWSYNNVEEKLLLTYFFYENEQEELLHQQMQMEQCSKDVVINQKPKHVKQKVEDYETDAGLEASLDEADESDDELSDSDSELTSSLLSKSAPIMAYEKNLAKRWPQQRRQQSQSHPPTPPDPAD